MKNSYSPYSHFRVGASLLTKQGRVFTGCNIESAAYWPSLCAERVAIFKAVSEGYKEFTELAIFTEAKDLSFSCGGCRQVLQEFADLQNKDIKITMANSYGKKATKKLSKIFPNSFGPKSLRK